MNYDVNYFIKKFEAIPEELWAIREHRIGNKSCALGHCHVQYTVTQASEGEYNAIGKVFSDLTVLVIDESCANDYEIGDLVRGHRAVACINNGESKEYQQPTPKQRILAALYDIKKMQEPKHPEVVYKVVEVDRKVKELVKQERILN